MKVFHDWEFLEEENSVYPISVGMVAENGAELYYEFANAPWTKIYQHEWLKEYVVPHLLCSKDGSLVTGEGTAVFKGKLAIMSKVYDFLKKIDTLEPGKLELWGWYSSYDHVCLGQLFGRMIDLPSFVPKYTNDLEQELHALGNPINVPVQTSGVHNALEDAKFMLEVYNWMKRGNQIDSFGSWT